MKRIFGYCRVNKHTDIKQTGSIFSDYGCIDIIFDECIKPNAMDSPWNMLKKTLTPGKDTLIIDTIESLGKTGREIFKKLNWLYENKVELKIISLPSSFKPQAPPNEVLTELYSYLAKKERKNVLQGQIIGQEKAKKNNISSGRPLTPFPKNWDMYYEEWINKKITASEFMNLAGVKKGTFYNLIKRYKAESAIENNLNA